MTRALAIAAAAALALPACSQPPVNRDASVTLTSAPSVDLESYLGRWYEIARFPNRFEEDCVGVTADYSLRDDGLVRVVNTCRKDGFGGDIEIAEGRARVVEGSNNSRLKVSFFGPFWGDYWILDIAPDYGWAMVGEPEGRYLWLLSRKPVMPERVLAERLSALARLGYDIDALYYTPQMAEAPAS